MRKLINLLVIVVMTLMAILPLTSQAAETPSYEVTLQQTDPDPEHDPDPAQKGKRIPSRPLMLVITPEGIGSPFAPAEIISYEIWDDAGACIISVPDETPFIEEIYSLQGQGAYTIRILTSDKAYIGLLYL